VEREKKEKVEKEVDKFEDEFEGKRRQAENEKAIQFRASLKDLKKKLDGEEKTKILKIRSIINKKITDAMVVRGIPSAEATKYHLKPEASFWRDWFW